MEELVSIVVPFYNAGKFLNKCIESILGQTYVNIQLILVNNLSTDNSLSIANSYLKIDSRVQVLECRNKGVSYSRNCGIENAKGKWILFIDADDYIEKNTIELMLSLYHKDKNIVCIESGYFYEVVNDIKLSNCNEGITTEFDREGMLEELFDSSIGHYQGYLWNKLLLLSIIKENNILFDTDILYNEDRLFLCKYFIMCPDISNTIYLPKPLYHYIQHKNSAMAVIHKQPLNNVITEIVAFDRMYDLLIKDYKEAAKKMVNNSICACLQIMRSSDINKNADEKQIIEHYLKKCKNMNFKTRIKKLVCSYSCLMYIYKLLKSNKR